jgi:hypothetical protein
MQVSKLPTVPESQDPGSYAQWTVSKKAKFNSRVLDPRRLGLRNSPLFIGLFILKTIAPNQKSF